jgi:hypothetical protein
MRLRVARLRSVLIGEPPAGTRDRLESGSVVAAHLLMVGGEAAAIRAEFDGPMPDPRL